jgi:hypothetical protein
VSESNPVKIEGRASVAEAMEPAKAKTRMNMAKPSAVVADRRRRAQPLDSLPTDGSAEVRRIHGFGFPSTLLRMNAHHGEKERPEGRFWASEGGERGVSRPNDAGGA